MTRPLALVHVALLRLGGALGRAARQEHGQGTVEYVALILLVAAVLAGVVVATRSQHFGPSGIAEAIVGKIKAAIDHVH